MGTAALKEFDCSPTRNARKLGVVRFEENERLDRSVQQANCKEHKEGSEPVTAHSSGIESQQRQLCGHSLSSLFCITTREKCHMGRFLYFDNNESEVKI
jgi:hypothetical protein